MKILVTALCRAGGVPGGLFTPSLFVGALVGDAFGLVARKIFPQASMSQPVIYALVGMGAILAGTIQAPITAILMVFEMTHDYGIILPLMSASIASALVSHLLQAGSLYTEPLLRRGIRLPPALAPTWLREPTLKGVIIPGAATVSPAESFAKLMETFLKAPEGQDQLYVTNSEGAYLGAISLHEIKSSFRETGNLDSVIAADVFNPSFPCVYAGDTISRAAELLAESDFERLPVLDGPVSRKLLGTVSKRKLLSAYREANLPHLEVRRSPHSPPEGTDRSPHSPPEGTDRSPHNPPEGTDRYPLDSPKGDIASSPGNSSHEEPMLTENEYKEKSR